MMRRIKPKDRPIGPPGPGNYSGTGKPSDFKQLVDRACRGEANAVLELKRTLDRHPSLWQELGDIAAMTQMVVIQSLASGDRLLQESIQRKADEMERELTGEDATPLYRLAAKRFVATWLQLQHADAAAAKSHNASLQQAKFWAQRQDQASKRYERALKALLELPKCDPARSEEDPRNSDANPKEMILKMAGRG